MKKTVLFALMISAFCILPNSVFCIENSIELFMPDGQLLSHPIRVFVTKDITESMNPKLKLTCSHAITKKKDLEDTLIKPEVVARHQKWVQEIQGQRIGLTGTLLLFDLSEYPIPFYKAVIRVTPTLVWEENTEKNEVVNAIVGSNEIYMGNSIGAFGWTLILVMVLVLSITSWCRRVKGKALYLLCGPDGLLSLSRTQVAAWTVAIGSVISGYGLIKLQVPDIPESLIALMGLSLATGGISYIQTQKKTAESGKNVKSSESVSSDNKYKPHLADLVCDSTDKLSLPKAQMVFWTGLTLTLFLVKSIIGGALWEVSWEMVAFMGMSQAGYLAPKIKFDQN